MRRLIKGSELVGFPHLRDRSAFTGLAQRIDEIITAYAPPESLRQYASRQAPSELFVVEPRPQFKVHTDSLRGNFHPAELEEFLDGLELHLKPSFIQRTQRFSYEHDTQSAHRFSYEPERHASYGDWTTGSILVYDIYMDQNRATRWEFEEARLDFNESMQQYVERPKRESGFCGDIYVVIRPADLEFARDVPLRAYMAAKTEAGDMLTHSITTGRGKRFVAMKHIGEVIEEKTKNFWSYCIGGVPIHPPGM